MIIVVGTSHTIQTADLELKSFLENLCQEFKVRAVAEEMNEEALAEKICAASIPMQVASTLQLPHRLCDPNRGKHAQLEIHQENDIRIQAWLSQTTLSESEVAVRIAESHAKRERYWLEQLGDLDLWPVLFAEQITSHHFASSSSSKVFLCTSQQSTGYLATQPGRLHCRRKSNIKAGFC